MSDNISEDMVLDLDLNLDPPPPPTNSLLGLGSLLSDLETTHGRIEDRIRQLEAVTARARQRQRWRQARNPIDALNLSIEPMVNLGIENGVHQGVENLSPPQESRVERGIGYKRDSSHLVARALEMDSEVKKGSNSGGSFYDCNICLEMPREPVLTCCGHLFCWACFYQLSYIDSRSKECPVCKGEVSDSSIIPIYGNGNDTRVSELESGVKIPPRPRANRVESVRHIMQNGFSHIPVAEALRRIRNLGSSIGGGGGAAVEQPRQQDLGGGGVLGAEAGGSRRFRSRQFSRVLSESAASLSSISSALNNAERLVEDLETYIHDRLLRRNDARFLLLGSRDPFSSNAGVINSGSQTVDSTSEVNSMVIAPLSSSRSDISDAIVHLENVSTNTAAPLTSSTSRRRSGVSRVPDGDNEVSRESRRRRLR
ncbi:hypothetical protein LguiA_010626 [Lonicera macranthoides]